MRNSKSARVLADTGSKLRSVAVVNWQKGTLNLTATSAFIRRLRHALRMGKSSFNLCFVDDRAIRRLNRRYLKRTRPTDVLAFPWKRVGRQFGNGVGDKARKNFLGEVVISVETARRNAQAEGHSTLNEIRWLILHGVLHLLGYNHEADQGEMTRLELLLRERLGIAGSRASRTLRKHGGCAHG